MAYCTLYKCMHPMNTIIIILYHIHIRIICGSQILLPKNSIVTDEDLRGWNTLHFNLFPLLRECLTTAYSYLCRSNEPLSNYQILLYLQSELNSQNFIHMICLTCSVKPISAGSLKALFATVGILVSHGIALLLQSKLMVTFLTLTACFQTKSHHL